MSSTSSTSYIVLALHPHEPVPSDSILYDAVVLDESAAIVRMEAALSSEIVVDRRSAKEGTVFVARIRV
jgi:hypothetical protein